MHDVKKCDLPKWETFIGFKTNMTSINGNLQTVIDAARAIDRKHDSGWSL
jgi:hypothetical protein